MSLKCKSTVEGTAETWRLEQWLSPRTEKECTSLIRYVSSMPTVISLLPSPKDRAKGPQTLKRKGSSEPIPHICEHTFSVI